VKSGMAQTRKQKVLQEVKRRRKQRTVVSIIIVAVLISIIGVGVWALSRNSGGGPPFPCGAETTNLHVHPWLRIWIETSFNSYNVTIPSGIGIISSSCFEPVHTHDASGLIHLESAHTSDIYTLNDFFNVWKTTPSYSTVSTPGLGNLPVVYNSTDILGYKPDRTHTLSLLIDEGQSTYQNSTAFGNLVLNQYDFCYSGLPANSAPCYPSDVGPTSQTDQTPIVGNPYYGGQSYPYGTGHTIVIYYKSV